MTMPHEPPVIHRDSLDIDQLLREYQRYRHLPMPLANLIRSPMRLSVAFALAVDVLVSAVAVAVGASTVPVLFSLLTIPFEAYALYTLLDC